MECLTHGAFSEGAKDAELFYKSFWYSAERKTCEQYLKYIYVKLEVLLMREILNICYT
jgi:hypothetical protein